MLTAGLADGPETGGSAPPPTAPHTPQLKAGHQRGLPPRRRPPSARSSCPAVDWFRHGFLGVLLLPLHRTLLCCSGGTGLHGGREGGHVWWGSGRGYCGC